MGQQQRGQRFQGSLWGASPSGLGMVESHQNSPRLTKTHRISPRLIVVQVRVGPFTGPLGESGPPPLEAPQDLPVQCLPISHAVSAHPLLRGTGLVGCVMVQGLQWEEGGGGRGSQEAQPLPTLDAGCVDRLKAIVRGFPVRGSLLADLRLYKYQMCQGGLHVPGSPVSPHVPQNSFRRGACLQVC